jgi:hypothetical protein
MLADICLYRRMRASLAGSGGLPGELDRPNETCAAWRWAEHNQR